MVVFHPEGGEEQLPPKMDALRTLLTTHGGDVSDISHWGRRRLAYPIRQQFEADYVIAAFAGAGDNVEVERALNIDEAVLRHLLIRRDSDGVPAAADGDGTEASPRTNR